MTSSGLLNDPELIPGGIASDWPFTGPSYQIEPLPSPGNTSAEFHKYTFDWQENFVRWLVDDQEIRRLDKADVNATEESEE